MLSGRYRTQLLCSKWTNTTSSICPQQDCYEIESLRHMLLHCSSYADLRSSIIGSWTNFNHPLADFLASTLVGPDDLKMQLLLDPTSIPDVIQLTNLHGKDILSPMFAFTRNWCYSIHRSRRKLLQSRKLLL